MAKIRLNNDRRDILHRHAISVVQNTPDDPKMIARAKKSEVALVKAHKNLVAEVHKIVAKAVTPAELKVLRKYSATSKGGRPRIVDVDTRDFFDVKLFNQTVYRLTMKKTQADLAAMDMEQRQKWNSKHNEAQEAARAELPSCYTGYRHDSGAKTLESTKTLNKLRGAYRKAKDEHEMATQLLVERHNTLLNPFKALIETANTYEDVCTVWEEATDVVEEMTATTRQVSVMSDEAIAKIRANVKLRNK